MLGRYDEALTEIEGVIAERTANPSLGATHTYTLTNRQERAILLGILGRYDEALTEIEGVITEKTANPSLGATHPNSFTSCQLRDGIREQLHRKRKTNSATG
jgi:hypothetical protein